MTIYCNGAPFMANQPDPVPSCDSVISRICRPLTEITVTDQKIL